MPYGGSEERRKCFELVVWEGLLEEERIELVLQDAVNFLKWSEEGIEQKLNLKRYTLSVGKNSAMAGVECQEAKQLGNFSKINVSQIAEDLEFQVQEFGFLKELRVKGRKRKLWVYGSLSLSYCLCGGYH